MLKGKGVGKSSWKLFRLVERKRGQLLLEATRRKVGFVDRFYFIMNL
jgi:hypothetical protein